MVNRLMSTEPNTYIVHNNCQVHKKIAFSSNVQKLWEECQFGMNISREGNVVTVSTDAWYLKLPIMYDDFTRGAFRRARKSYGLRSCAINSTTYLWKGGTWQYELNPEGRGVRFGISQDWSFQHFVDNNLPRYMLLEEFVRGQEISLSRGPLSSHPDVFDICTALRTRCSHKRRKAYFANIRPVRPVGTYGPIWHPRITHIMRTKLLSGFGVSETPRCEGHVWLSREHSRTRNGRRIINERELVRAYTSQFPDTFTLSNEPLSEAVAFLSSACVVAGVHGGLMYKTLFAPAHADVVEFANARTFYGIFWVISESARHSHHLVLSEDAFANVSLARRIFHEIHAKPQR